MPQDQNFGDLPISYRARLQDAITRVETFTAKEVLALRDRQDVVLIDLRDGYELETYGRIPGSHHCPRGSLEFRIGPDSPHHMPIFAADKHFIFHCSHGLRSVLAADLAQQMGLQKVGHLGGGIIAWIAAGGPVEGGSQTYSS